MEFSRQEYWSGLPFPSPVDHILSDLSTMTRPSWVAPLAWLSFIELDKAVVLVWLDWLVFSDYGFSVSALWCPLATPTILLGFLLPWMWGISSRLLQQSAATAPYLGPGVSPHSCPFWPWMWNSSSRPSCIRAATAPWRFTYYIHEPWRFMYSFSNTWIVNFQLFKLVLEKAEDPETKVPTSLDHRKRKRDPEKHLFLHYSLCQSLWLCGSQ